MPHVVRLVQGILLSGVLVFAVTTIPGVRPAPGFDPGFDGWLQGSGYVVAAVLAVLRPLLCAVDRLVWSLIAGALACRAFAFVVFLSVVRDIDPIPYPSVADAGWLMTSVLLAAALMVLIRSRFRHVSASFLLDGAVGAFAAAAVMFALLSDTVRTLIATGTPPQAVLVNIAYPALDVMLLVLVLGLLAGVQWQLSFPLVLLVGGITGFAILDTVFLSQQAAGTFRPGTYLSVLSLAATVAIGWASCTRGGLMRAGRREWLPTLLAPTVFSVVCLSLLVYATQRPVPGVSVLLASVGMLIIVCRTAFSFRTVRAVADARQDARTDELTGIANRRAFNEAMDHFLQDRPEEEHLALLVIDLDDFKEINDALGHQQGDEMLTMLADRLRLALTPEDLLARIGGDEFAVIMESADAQTAARAAERLQAVLRQPFTIEESARTVSASIGIAHYPVDGRDGSELLRNADLAMYAAKANHAGYTRFQPEIHHVGRERVERVARLRAAIADGEMTLLYQPQVSLTSGVIIGVEALVRWQHPQRGMLAPSEFLRSVESGGLMSQLTHSVLSQALHQSALWQAAGTPVTVSVNISVSDLVDPRFPERVADMLGRFAVTGDVLVLELTEDMFLADQVRAQRAITALTSLGISIAVDDYGTGYSSLGYVRDLPQISELKMDRSFITNVCTDGRSAAIVESTVHLASALDLHLIAEGVETMAVRNRLADLGCTMAQGFLFSRPVQPAHLDLTTNFTGWVDDGQPSRPSTACLPPSKG